jgi:hypothetical protein
LSDDFEYEFPALVRIRRQRNARDQSSVVRASDKVTVRRVSTAEAPLAGVVYRPDGRAKYRVLDGGVYVTLRRFDDLRRSKTQQRLFRYSGLETLLLEEIGKEADLLTSKDLSLSKDTMKTLCSFPWPKRTYPSVTGMPHAYSLAQWGNRDLFINAIPSLDDYAPSMINEDDLNRWRERAREVVGNLILCGDDVLVKTDMPLLFVHDSREISINQDSFRLYSLREDNPRNSHGVWENRYYYPMLSSAFNLNSFEKAKECQLEFFEMKKRQLHGQKLELFNAVERVEIDDPAVFDCDIEPLELRRLGDKVLERFGYACFTASRARVLRKDVPEDVLESALDLEKALSEEEGGIDLLEDSLDEALGVLGEFRTYFEKKGIDVLKISSMIEYGLDRWDQRSVSISRSPKPSFQGA